MALIGNATGEGKSGPVETGLTGPAATALLSLCYQSLQMMKVHRPKRSVAIVVNLLQ